MGVYQIVYETYSIVQLKIFMFLLFLKWLESFWSFYRKKLLRVSDINGWTYS